MIEMLDNTLKKVILDRWDAEILWNQRVHLDLIFELHHIRWYDQDVWDKLIPVLMWKKKINAFKDFVKVHQTLCYMNEDKEHCPMAGQLGSQIQAFMDKHYTEDRKWKYCDKRRIEKPLKELIARRDEPKLEDYARDKQVTDEKMLRQAKEAERKLKRLKMAKYSLELFDEIIQEMMKEKKTFMEMMAELDCDDNAIYAAQTRLARTR